MSDKKNARIDKANATLIDNNSLSDKKNFRIGKTNLILLAVGLLIIIVGFLLMLGAPSGDTYNPDIFSKQRITVGPMVSLFGFVFIIFAILFQSPKSHNSK